MSRDTISALQKELTSTTANIPLLERAVAAAQEKLRFSAEKIAQIKLVIQMLEAEASERVTTVVEAPKVAAEARAVPVSKTSKSGLMEAEITNILSLRGPTHRKDILAALIDKKIMGHEKSPMAHLAAFLSSKKDLYEPNGSGVFTLKRYKFGLSDTLTNQGSINGTGIEPIALSPNSPPMVREEQDEYDPRLFRDE